MFLQESSASSPCFAWDARRRTDLVCGAPRPLPSSRRSQYVRWAFSRGKSAVYAVHIRVKCRAWRHHPRASHA
eukprot:1885510-Rhodomonas_salina.2